MNINRKVLGIAVASALIVGATIPALASAKTVKIKMTQTATLKGIKLTGTVKGKPFGKCKVKGTVLPPKANVTWTCKGGTIKLKTTDAKVVGSNFVSTAKLTGTGKYKKLKGKVKNTGSVTTASSLSVGTATY